MERIRLGMLTPSSNTVLEPVTSGMLAGLPEVSAHFARFRVTRIALSEDALAQFDVGPVLEAACLLADAHMDVIAWSGTSAGWLGFESDRLLCAAITEATGVPATTAVLGLNAAMARLGVRRLGLVTPYTGDVQARIVANYAAEGIEVVSERHLEDPGNYSFARYEAEELADLAREVAGGIGGKFEGVRPDAVMALCTNLRSSGLAEAMEAEMGVPFLDSIAATVWHSLVLAGVDPGRVEGWGGIFALA